MNRNRRKICILLALAAMLLFMPLYTASAAQTGSHDSRLAKFDIAPGDLSPAFDPEILEYTAVLDADVTAVSVQAVPRSEGGTIASVEGAKTLQPGINTITVICSAPDKSFTTYTITVTVGGSAAGIQNEGTDTEGIPDTPVGDWDSAADDTVAPAASALTGPVESDGTATLNGASYQLSNNFSYSSITQDIPSEFTQGTLEIEGTSYSTLTCETNGVHLVYMENTDGNGSTGFYFYDEMQKAVERFKYAKSGDNFVIFISTARDAVPEGYVETTLTLPSDKDVAAYQSSAEGMQDYYVIYGINSDGTNGWYLYDNAQGTYMRYVQTMQSSGQTVDEDEELERTVSLEKYNSLYEQYTSARTNHVKVVSVMAIVLVGIIIIFTAILLRNGDFGSGEEGDGQENKERFRAKKRLNKAKRQSTIRQGRTLAAGKAFSENISDKSAKDARKSARKNKRMQKGLKASEHYKKSVKGAEDMDEDMSAQENKTPNMDDIYRQNGRMPEPEEAYRQRTPESAETYRQRMPEPAETYRQNGRMPEPAETYRKRTPQPAENHRQRTPQPEEAYRQRMPEEAASYRQQVSEEQNMYRQTVRRDISTPEEIREQLSHASSRRNSILGGQPSSDDDSVQLAAQRMRQSVQRMHRPPEPQEEQIKDAYSEPKRTMSEEDRQAVFRPTKRISLDEVNKERSAENDWEAEEAAVNQKRSRRKKHSLLDEDMEIMDLNDL